MNIIENDFSTGFYCVFSKPTMTIEQEGPNAVQATDVNEENVNLVVQVTENEADTLDQRDTKYFPKVAVISLVILLGNNIAFFWLHFYLFQID